MLGHELVRLARSADPNRRLVDIARPALEKLRDSAGESASLAIPRARADMDIVLQLDPERHVGVANWVGTEVPLHASSAGKVVLAELGRMSSRRARNSAAPVVHGENDHGHAR